MTLRRGERRAFMPSPDNKPLMALHERYKNAREMKRISLENGHTTSYNRYSQTMVEIKTAMVLIVRAKLRVLGLISAEEVHRVRLTYQAAYPARGLEECWLWSLSEAEMPEHRETP